MLNLFYKFITQWSRYAQFKKKIHHTVELLCSIFFLQIYHCVSVRSSGAQFILQIYHTVDPLCPFFFQIYHTVDPLCPIFWQIYHTVEPLCSIFFKIYHTVSVELLCLIYFTNLSHSGAVMLNLKKIFITQWSCYAQFFFYKFITVSVYVALVLNLFYKFIIQWSRYDN